MSAVAVQARGITKRYGATVALQDAGITVRAGETHALVGRNGAGKSTMVAILTGLQRPDAGEVRFAGRPAPPLSDPDAWRQRVACVYQKSTIIPGLSVAENLFLNRQNSSTAAGSPGGDGRAAREGFSARDGYGGRDGRGGHDGPRRPGWSRVRVPGAIDWRGLRRRAAELLDGYGVVVDPARMAGELSVEQRQLVEIARALSFGARFIILDEPTAQLDAAAIDRLFERMRVLQGHGVTFLYISHHLREVYEVCQTVTVFRDARHVLTRPVAQLSHDALVQAMTGEGAAQPVLAAGRTAEQFPARPGPGRGTNQDRDRRTERGEDQAADRAPDHAVDRAPGPAAERAADRGAASAAAVLEVRDLGLAGSYAGINLVVRAGEVVGLLGSGSSGKVALAETIAGLRKADAGTIAVAGVRPRPGSVPAALRAGLGYLPQDRHREGLVPLLSVAENATLSIADRLGPAGVILPARQRALAERMITAYGIRTAGPWQPVNGLSGGNAQKVVLARALASEPAALVLVNPTAGIDVRSKQSLLGAVLAAAAGGTGVLIVTDDLDDARSCDRVLVMFHGRVVREAPRGWTDADLVAAVEGVGQHD